MNESNSSAIPPEAGEKNWLALSSSTEVFGPFTQEELKAYVEAGQIVATAQFFQRQATLEGADAQIGPLMRRVAEAEERQRSAESTVSRLEADLKAKDLEFEGERQQMLADLSKLRAECLRKDADVESLRKVAAHVADLEKARIELETKTRECERRMAALAAEAATAQAGVEAAERKGREQIARLEARLKNVEAAYGERGRRLAELAESLRTLAGEPFPDVPTEDIVAEEVSSSGPTLRAKPKVSDVVEDVEVIEPEPKAKAPSGGASGDARLASLEALAQQELARLQSQGGGGMPRWARKRR